MACVDCPMLFYHFHFSRGPLKHFNGMELQYPPAVRTCLFGQSLAPSSRPISPRGCCSRLLLQDQRKTSGDGKSSSLSRVTPRGSQNILNPYLDSSSKSRGIRQMHGRTSSTPTPQDERCADEEKKQDQKRKVTGSPNKIQVHVR